SRVHQAAPWAMDDPWSGVRCAHPSLRVCIDRAWVSACGVRGIHQDLCDFRGSFATGPAVEQALALHHFGNWFAGWRAARVCRDWRIHCGPFRLGTSEFRGTEPGSHAAHCDALGIFPHSGGTDYLQQLLFEHPGPAPALICLMGDHVRVNAQYNIAAPDSIAIKIAGFQRRRMYDAFLAASAIEPTDTILDLGVTSDQTYDHSNYFIRWYPYKHRITAAGIDDAAFLEQQHPGLKFVFGDGRSLPFADRQFDFVHSSAVL